MVHILDKTVWFKDWEAIFLIKNLEKKVAEYVNSCSYCQMFTNIVYRNPIKPNRVPERCWEETSIDLFGPLPSKNHI